MADLSITATSVVPSSGYGFAKAAAGETITAGQAIYLSSSDGKVYKSDANGAAATNTVTGIALNGGAINQPIEYQTTGSITIGATVTVGTIYVLSATAGGICPAADLATGYKVCEIGVGTSASVIKLNIHNSGATVP